MALARPNSKVSHPAHRWTAPLLQAKSVPDRERTLPDSQHGFRCVWRFGRRQCGGSRRPLELYRGGTANWDYLYVYKMVHSQPQVMSILEGGSRGYGGLTRVAIQNGLLVLDFADPDRRVGDCCSEGYIRVRYRWTKSKFVEDGPRERGNSDLRVR